VASEAALMGENTGEKSTEIRRHIIGSLSVFEITDYELEILQQGSPGSVYLNFGVFFLSSATSIILALCTSALPDRMYTAFCIFAAITVTAGVSCVWIWFRSFVSIKGIVAKIKART
jgi:hypothetical protein